MVLGMPFPTYSDADIGLQRRILLGGVTQCRVMTLTNEILRFDNASEHFENTCLGPIGHQVSIPKFATAAVD